MSLKMASKAEWSMPQPQPQQTWDGGASDDLPPPPTYEEAMSSIPQPHAPSNPSYHPSAPTVPTPSYHPSAPTAPYPSSYPYLTSSCMPSAPTSHPTTKPTHPTGTPHRVTALRPDTSQHIPLRVPPRAAPDNEPRPVVVTRQPQQQEQNTKPEVNAIIALGAVIFVVMILLKWFIF